MAMTKQQKAEYKLLKSGLAELHRPFSKCFKPAMSSVDVDDLMQSFATDERPVSKYPFRVAMLEEFFSQADMDCARGEVRFYLEYIPNNIQDFRIPTLEDVLKYQAGSDFDELGVVIDFLRGYYDVPNGANLVDTIGAHPDIPLDKLYQLLLEFKRQLKK